MDYALYAALVATLGALGTIIGYVVRLMDRINKADTKAEKAESRADSAALAAASARMDIARLDGELHAHRLHTAERYVSRDTLNSLEKRILDAIDGVNTRLDKLFTPTHS